MMRTWELLLWPLILSASGRYPVAKSDPQYDLKLSAFEQMNKWLKSGSLPGIAKGRHGALFFDRQDFKPTYPAEVLFQATLDREPNATYYYRLRKQSAGQGWELVRAWRVPE